VAKLTSMVKRIAEVKKRMMVINYVVLIVVWFVSVWCKKGRLLGTCSVRVSDPFIPLLKLGWGRLGKSAKSLLHPAQSGVVWCIRGS